MTYAKMFDGSKKVTKLLKGTIQTDICNSMQHLSWVQHFCFFKCCLLCLSSLQKSQFFLCIMIVGSHYFACVHSSIHCAKIQIFGPEFARIRIGERHVCCNVLTYSMTPDSKYTRNILFESGLFFRIQIEYS